MPAKKKSYRTTIHRDGAMCAIPVPFDPKPLFGKTRAPVRVTLAGYTFRSTISKYGEDHWIPLRKSHREAAGLEGDETLEVTLVLDDEKREVTPPDDLVKALRKAKAWKAWEALSFTHQREHAEAVEGAKKPETRARRIEKSVAMIASKTNRS